EVMRKMHQKGVSTPKMAQLIFPNFAPRLASHRKGFVSSRARRADWKEGKACFGLGSSTSARRVSVGAEVATLFCTWLFSCHALGRTPAAIMSKARLTAKISSVALQNSCGPLRVR